MFVRDFSNVFQPEIRNQLTVSSEQLSVISEQLFINPVFINPAVSTACR